MRARPGNRLREARQFYIILPKPEFPRSIRSDYRYRNTSSILRLRPKLTSAKRGKSIRDRASFPPKSGIPSSDGPNGSLSCSSPVSQLGRLGYPASFFLYFLSGQEKAHSVRKRWDRDFVRYLKVSGGYREIAGVRSAMGMHRGRPRVLATLRERAEERFIRGVYI